ncbi:hypothetical protein ACTJJ4_07615 [Microbacterium sp. 22195]|uniref:hypothetical protein n=1 Tax=Microbacterium sp. 22195 TaxID=3453891 RepID=UPI003F8734F3
MAREQITHNHIVSRPLPEYNPATPGPHEASPVSVEVPRRNVHVQWNRTGTTDAAGLETGWLQLGIDITIAEIRDLLKYAEDEAAAAKLGNAAFGDYDTEQHQVRVYSSELSRPEINKAITALRRGRDVAYGKDA